MTEPEAASTDPIVRPEADQGIEPAATPMQQAQEPAETRHVETPREEPLAVESIPEQHGVQKGDEAGVHATNSPGRVENVEQSPPKEADASSEGAVAAPPSERVQTALERAAAAGKEWRPPVSDTTAVLARAAAAGKEWRPPVPAAPVDPRPSLPPMKIITQKDWLMRTAPTLARAGLYNLNDMELATLLVTRNVPNVGTQISAPLLPSTSDPHGRCIAIVEFKRKRLRKYDAARDVLVGSHVMVDSDRGTDIGLVVRVIRLGADGHITLGTLPNADIPLDKLIQTDGRLIREARPEEIHALYSWLPLLEQQALNAVRLRSKYHKLDIALVDCEFQFDGKKVTFFFDAEPGTVIDFRDLVRDMYALYKARIWMENINPKGPKMNAADGSPEKPEADSAPS